eukprot:225893-Chlamydomonas_euryale.AAC.1
MDGGAVLPRQAARRQPPCVHQNKVWMEALCHRAKRPGSNRRVCTRKKVWMEPPLWLGNHLHVQRVREPLSACGQCTPRCPPAPIAV